MDSRFIALDLYNQKNGIHPTQLFIDTFSAKENVKSPLKPLNGVSQKNNVALSSMVE